MYVHKLTGVRVSGKPRQEASQRMELSQVGGQPPQSGPSGSGATPKGKAIVGKTSKLTHIRGMAEKVHRLRMSRKTNPNDLIPHEVRGPGEAPAGMAPPPQGPPPAPASGKGAGRGRVKIALHINNLSQF